MNLIKKLILGSAFIGGAVICGLNSAYATMQPFPGHISQLPMD